MANSKSKGKSSSNKTKTPTKSPTNIKDTNKSKEIGKGLGRVQKKLAFARTTGNVQNGKMTAVDNPYANGNSKSSNDDSKKNAIGTDVTQGTTKRQTTQGKSQEVAVNSPTGKTYASALSSPSSNNKIKHVVTPIPVLKQAKHNNKATDTPQKLTQAETTTTNKKQNKKETNNTSTSNKNDKNINDNTNNDNMEIDDSPNSATGASNEKDDDNSKHAKEGDGTTKDTAVETDWEIFASGKTQLTSDDLAFKVVKAKATGKQQTLESCNANFSENITYARYTLSLHTREKKTNKEALQSLCEQLKDIVKAIHEAIGPNIAIAHWDPDTEDLKNLWTKSTNLPHGNKGSSDKEKLSRFLGYVNPSKASKRMSLPIRFALNEKFTITQRLIGKELIEAFDDLDYEASVSRNPRPCQAAKTAVIGWLHGSTKTIDEKTFLPAVRKALKLPEAVIIGVQWRAICDEHGKRPPYEYGAKQPSALHLLIDKKYQAVYQARSAELWKKKGTGKLPNGVQLRLVPCFSSDTARAMTATQRNSTKQMCAKQFHLTEKVILTTDYYFITELDAPCSNEDSRTLRRFIMSKNPLNFPSQRLIHNVDQSWNDSKQYVFTYARQFQREAEAFITSLIPEVQYYRASAAKQWFTEIGLQAYEDVLFDPKQRITTSAADKDARALVDEDIWGMGYEWKQDTSRPPNPETVNPQDEEKAAQQLISEQAASTQPAIQRLPGDAKSVPSLGSVFNRDRDPDESEEEATDTEVKVTDIQFDAAAIQKDADANSDPQRDDRSMSTAGLTTGSTRIALKENKTIVKQQRQVMIDQQEEMEEQAKKLEAQAEEIAMLQKLFAQARAQPPEQQPSFEQSEHALHQFVTAPVLTAPIEARQGSDSDELSAATFNNPDGSPDLDTDDDNNEDVQMAATAAAIDQYNATEHTDSSTHETERKIEEAASQARRDTIQALKDQLEQLKADSDNMKDGDPKDLDLSIKTDDMLPADAWNQNSDPNPTDEDNMSLTNSTTNAMQLDPSPLAASSHKEATDDDSKSEALAEDSSVSDESSEESEESSDDDSEDPHDNSDIDNYDDDNPDAHEEPVIISSDLQSAIMIATGQHTDNRKRKKDKDDSSIISGAELVTTNQRGQQDGIARDRKAHTATSGMATPTPPHKPTGAPAGHVAGEGD